MSEIIDINLNGQTDNPDREREREIVREYGIKQHTSNFISSLEMFVAALGFASEEPFFEKWLASQFGR